MALKGHCDSSNCSGGKVVFNRGLQGARAPGDTHLEIIGRSYILIIKVSEQLLTAVHAWQVKSSHLTNQVDGFGELTPLSW